MLEYNAIQIRVSEVRALEIGSVQPGTLQVDPGEISVMLRLPLVRDPCTIRTRRRNTDLAPVPPHLWIGG